MKTLITISLFITLFLFGCANHTQVKENQESDQLQEEPGILDTNTDQELDKLASDFGKSINKTIDSLNDDVDSLIENDETDQIIQDFQDDFQESLDKITEQDNQEMIEDMVNNMNDHLEDGIETLEDNLDEMLYKDKLDEAILEDQIMENADKMVKEQLKLQELLDDFKKTIQQEKDDFNKKIQEDILHQIITDIKNTPEIGNKSTKHFGCEQACTLYKKCAGFGQGVGEKGMNEAYQSCFTSCQKWSEQTLNCMKEIKINSAMDCMPLTQCALKEYNTKGF